MITTQIKLECVIFGDALIPENFSNIAKITPTSYWFKGDAIPHRQVHITRKETRWAYTDGFIKTQFVDEVYALFMKKFNSNIENIIQYINENNLETRINIIIEMKKNQKPALNIDREFMSFIMKMNGEIDIDLYIY